MILNKKDACQALIDGKIIIAYFGNNGDYKHTHLATPVEVRLFGNQFCTYTSHGTHKRKLTESDIMEALDKKIDSLRICPVCILDERPINEPMKSK
ncbi:hypothetical protein ACMSDQ_18120 [Bacteroides thetaiotaomicron]|jgi:hypothetical protein|uniref:hypothetical protein n=1 Tax=Bacteroides TaxID=816 RepID=UPI001C2C05FE|nr:hypothetical protein [Bacteroides sp. MSK.20.82]MBU9879672.1 hypothetical protein [Bacteroides sp. MSK.20.82]